MLNQLCAKISNFKPPRDHTFNKLQNTDFAQKYKFKTLFLNLQYKNSDGPFLEKKSNKKGNISVERKRARKQGKINFVQQNLLDISKENRKTHIFIHSV